MALQTRIPLPARLSGSVPMLPPGSRRITVIGGNGVGKSRFMEETARLTAPASFRLSAVSGIFPSREESTMTGSIDDLYGRNISANGHFRPEALSELDRLEALLMADELKALLRFKESLVDAPTIINGEHSSEISFPSPTPLDHLRNIWKDIFPGTSISALSGALRFRPAGSEDFIPVGRLSRGEQAALYYSIAIHYAPENGVVFIDAPTLFLHYSVYQRLWPALEALRPDCVFIYNAINPDFISPRHGEPLIWVKGYDADQKAWDYELVDSADISDNILRDIAGARRPVLFIEGDREHSIDARLYAAVFHNYTVRPLGSCNKVIEATRAFNDLNAIHRLNAAGIVDRDRRTDQEVNYLRRKNIMVPEVAEIENMFLHPGILRVMARLRGRQEEKVIRKVTKTILNLFAANIDAQALEHVRHRIKREAEINIDSRFSCITALETHLKTLHNRLQPRKQYEELRKQFRRMVSEKDYEGVLRVFNHKPMLAASNIAPMLGFGSVDAYIHAVLEIMARESPESRDLRQAIRSILLVADPDISSFAPANKASLPDVKKIARYTPDNPQNKNVAQDKNKNITQDKIWKNN